MLLSFVLLGMSAMAGEPGVTFLLTNGQKVSFAFTSKPEITVGSEDIIVSSPDDVSVSYPFADLQKFYFEDDVEDYVTGIQSTEDKVSVRPVFRYVNGTITVSGLGASEKVSVLAVNGSTLCVVKADKSGNVRLDISDANDGVYVVSTSNGVSFKLLKK